MTDTARAHVVLPPDLLAEIDRLVGPRRRSQFFVEAVSEKLAKMKLAEVAQRAAGSLADAETPLWSSPEAASRWVHNGRLTDDRRQTATPGRGPLPD
jgi:hypothetical protein